MVAGAVLKRHRADFNLLERARVGVLLKNSPAVLTGVNLMNLLLLCAEELEVPPGCCWIHRGLT